MEGVAFRLRVQFPGAIYHGINRGNYRSWIFDDLRTKSSFEACLFARWTQALAAALRRVPPEFLICQLRSAPWKRAVALQLHASTDVSNGWLAQQLDMGSAAYVSKHLGLTRRKRSACLTPLLDLLNKGEGEA